MLFRAFWCRARIQRVEELNKAVPRAEFRRDIDAFRGTTSDLILLLDVIEHQEDDVGFLTEVVKTHLETGSRSIRPDHREEAARFVSGSFSP